MFNGTRRVKQARPGIWPNTQSPAVTIAGADAHEHSKYIVTAIKYSEACNWQVSWAKDWVVSWSLQQRRQHKSWEEPGLYSSAMVSLFPKFCVLGKNPTCYALSFLKEFLQKILLFFLFPPPVPGSALGSGFINIRIPKFRSSVARTTHILLTSEQRQLFMGGSVPLYFWSDS